MRLLGSLATIGVGLSIPIAFPAQSEPQAPEPASPTATAEGRTSGGDEAQTTTLLRTIQGQALLDDLEQFRSLLKREWMLSNLNNADFDAAIDAIAREAPKGMTLAELTNRLQRVLAMGRDGHAAIGQFNLAMQTAPGVRPDFLVDLDGDGYTAYLVGPAGEGAIHPTFDHRFTPLRPGYPKLLSIDGRPVSEWVRAASPWISKGPDPGVRWRAMRILQELPFLRREMHQPESPSIRVRLASRDGSDEIEIDAPTTPHQRWHFPVPRPPWRVLDGNVGYLWVDNPAAGVVEMIIRAMPELRDTKGLVIDLRDNTGGAGLETLQLLAAYLLPPDKPRIAVGQIVHWRGDRESTNTGEVSTTTDGLSAEGRSFLADFERKFERKWRPPAGRDAEPRTVFLARPEAEPDLFPYNHERWPDVFPYSAPVVVLFNHRCFSAAEIVLAGLAELPGVTLVGSATTDGGGGSPRDFQLRHSKLDVTLSGSVFVRRDGLPIDGRGIAPDVVVEPDADDYIGVRDRMLERAVEVLEEKLRTRG